MALFHENDYLQCIGLLLVSVSFRTYNPSTIITTMYVSHLSKTDSSKIRYTKAITK